MARHVERYKDVEVYIREIEDVYDVRLEFEFRPMPSNGQPMCRMIIRCYDKDDDNPSSGPFAYHQAEVPANKTFKQQQAIIRGLTSITYQCLQAYTNKPEPRRSSV